MKHTSTPWEIVSFDDRQIRIGDARVCVVKGSFQVGNDKANAKLIVKAVNEHAALVAVAEAAKKLLALHSKHSGQPPVSRNADACTNLHEAIQSLESL